MSPETLSLLRTGQLIGSRKLSLACGLEEFPSEIFDLADSLEILDLSNNHLKSLPDDFGRLKHLKAAFFANNDFEEIPQVLAQCPHLEIIGFKSNQVQHVSRKALSPTLRWLILTNNQIEQLPPEVGNLPRLQKLMLAGNRLSSLPETITGCQSLELIRLSANRLTELPVWLLSLPRLSWIAYAGNPFCTATLEPRAISTIDWNLLSLEKRLGEGASGIISRGLWQVGLDQTEAVAVKLFKGEITSDGLPMDEIQACMAAGVHPNLVRVLGKIENHPEQRAGLVLSLISPDYTNLGGPPNLDTCTRDTYATGTRFSLPFILRVASGIAAAADHLHRQGILHGDLYAHNILTNEAGDSLMGDFGAASFYNPEDTQIAKALESLEVRAFGCLLEDLLEHYVDDDPGIQQQTTTKLLALQQSCMHLNSSQRPQFQNICDSLESIQVNINQK